MFLQHFMSNDYLWSYTLNWNLGALERHDMDFLHYWSFAKEAPSNQYDNPMSLIWLTAEAKCALVNIWIRLSIWTILW